jgi:TolB protein
MGILLLFLALQDPAALIQELQSDDLGKRNAATAKLEKLGPEALPELTAARDRSNDPEVRSRLEKIVGEIEIRQSRPRRMVFTRGQESAGELYLWENGESRRLTENKVVEAGPRFSPDGSRLLYFVMDSIEGWKQATVVVMNLADRSTVKIGTGFESTWSPDGSRIAYARGAEIHVVKPDGTGDAVVYRAPAGPRGVVWSSDGKEMALEVNDAVWIITLADGKSRRVFDRTPKTSTLADWSWSPDGKTFAMVAGSGPYLWNVYTVAADGSGFGPRTRNGWVGHGVVQWAPDSRRVAVCVRLGSGMGPPDPQVGGLDTGPHLLDATNGLVRRVTKDVNPSLTPTWSPDGKFIVYATGKEEIWIAHAGTGAVSKITEMAVPMGAAASWFPPTVHWGGK